MLVLYYVILFFIITFNVLLYILLEKQKLEDKIYERAKASGFTTINCISGFWFVLEKNIYGLDLKFIERDEKMLSCSQEFLNTDSLVSCGKKGRFNNKNDPCWITISELLFLLN